MGIPGARSRPEPGLIKALRARATRKFFDTDYFRRHKEAAYQETWRRHLRGERPSHFAVPPDPP